MITVSIDVTKIDKSALYNGKKGTYLALTMFENKNGVDKYGNHGFIAQDLGKERRMAGEKGPILGNFKRVGGYTGQDSHNQSKSDGYQPQPADDDEIPF